MNFEKCSIQNYASGVDTFFNKKDIHLFGIRYSSKKKKCNKRAAAALFSAVYRAPHFHTIPEGAPSCKDCGAFPVKTVFRRIAARRKKCRNTLPAQILRQTIKVRAQSILISVAFFLTYVYCTCQVYSIRIQYFSIHVHFNETHTRVSMWGGVYYLARALRMHTSVLHTHTLHNVVLYLSYISMYHISLNKLPGVYFLQAPVDPGV